MSDEYQLRKDIDRIYRDLYDLNNDTLNVVTKEELNNVLKSFYDLSEVDTVWSKLKTDLGTLSGHLTTFRTSLIAFNQSLITFNGDTTTLASDLTKLSDNLEGLLSHIRQLGGDSTILADTLETLSEYLTGFSGTLTEFQNEIKTDIGTDAFNLLNEDIVKLLYVINVAQDNIDTVQTDISVVQVDMYGSNKDPSNPQEGSVLDNIEVAQDDIVTVKGDALELQEQIYGEDGNGTYSVENPSSDSLIGQIGDENTSGTILYDIDQAQKGLDYADSRLNNFRYNINSLLAPNTDFTYVYVYAHTGSPTSDDATFLTTLATDYGINNVQYACEKDGANYYKLVNGSWTAYNQSLSNVVALFGADSNGSSDISERNKYYWEKDWEYAYDLVTNQYYKHYNRYGGT